MIVRKISRIGATKCQFKALMHQIRFPLGLLPSSDPPGGAYSAPSDPLAVFKGSTSKWRNGERRRVEGSERKEEGKYGEGKGGEEKERMRVLLLRKGK